MKMETFGDIGASIPFGASFMDIGSPRFRSALEDVFWGRSPLVCIIGPGGCGKSVLLRAAALRFGDRCMCLAPTGVAAENLSFSFGTHQVKGITIHKGLGIPIIKFMPSNEKGSVEKAKAGSQSEEEFIAKASTRKRRTSIYSEDGHSTRYWPETISGSVAALSKVDVVLLDEVSMVSSDLFDLIMLHICAASRIRGRVIRLVCFGDPLQLPPVTKDGSSPKMFFDSHFWKALGPKVHVLDTVYRQSDGGFKAILNDLRRGNVTEEAKAFVKAHCISDPKASTKERLCIAPQNQQADDYNTKKEKALVEGSSPRKFHFPYQWIRDGKRLEDNPRPGDYECPSDMELYKGERVMCLKNAPDGSYRNGSLGTLVGCVKEKRSIEVDDRRSVELTLPVAVVLLDGSKVPVLVRCHEYGQPYSSAGKGARIFQVPIRRAWAVTYHKSQGLTLDSLRMETKLLKADGMFYLGLSRVRTPQGVALTGEPDWSMVAANPEALSFVEACEACADREDRTEACPQDV